MKVTAGRTIVYVVDCSFTDANVGKIVWLAKNADILFIETTFLEADSALANLKVAIQLRPENRYHARNDEDFAFLQEDPRFTELLYPEKDGLAS